MNASIVITAIVAGSLTTISAAGMLLARYVLGIEEKQRAEERADDAKDRAIEYGLVDTPFGVLPLVSRKSVSLCPFCGQNPKNWVNAHYFKKHKQNNKLIEARNAYPNALGPTSPEAVLTALGTKLYQGCLACGGEWLGDPVAPSPSTPATPST
jgi:hypothetical protein